MRECAAVGLGSASTSTRRPRSDRASASHGRRRDALRARRRGGSGVSRCCAENGNADSSSATSRRTAGLLGATVALTGSLIKPARSAQLSEEDMAITNTVYFDVGLCSTATKMDRTLGAKNIFCTENEQENLGRIEIGLYGNIVPTSVSNFVAAVNQGAFDQTIIHKVLRGQYILAGKPGSRKYGEVEMPASIGRNNSDLVSPKAFALRHTRPGTVSLYFQDPKSELTAETKNVANLEFAITTGPGPAPMLDDASIVIGTVTKGLEVISAIAEVPTFQPNANLKGFNKIAGIIGDDRAKNARGIWGKPRKAIIFTRTGQVVTQVPVESEGSGPMPVP